MQVLVLYDCSCARVCVTCHSGPLYIDINVERSNGENTIIRDVYMGRVPIMIYSSGCHVKDRVAKECVKDLIAHTGQVHFIWMCVLFST